jgi:hypothetical protein
MRPDDQDPEHDRELGRLLEEWNVPSLPDTLDARVRTLFRERMAPPPLWRRLLGTSIRVPLPVAVAVLLLLVLAVAIPRRSGPAPEVESAETLEPTRAVRAETPEGAKRSSLAGFEPVREMNVTVLSEGLTP